MTAEPDVLTLAAHLNVTPQGQLQQLSFPPFISDAGRSYTVHCSLQDQPLLL